MVAGLFDAAGYEVHATPGNWNNHIGLPLTICSAPRANSKSVWVLEMGANQPGDINELVSIASADCRVVTSIGAAHLEKLGSLDGVRRAKSEIFGHATRDTVAVVPFDERDRLALKGFAGRVYTTGEAQNADVRVVRANAYGTGQEVVISTADTEIPFVVSVPGRHNASNLATAVGVLEAMGISWRGLGKALGGLSLPGGRLRWEERGRWRFLNDAYNANPTSVRASYQTFVEATGTGPRVAVIGEMKELGAEATKLHGDLARSLAGQGGVDLLVFVGPFAKTMFDFADEVQGEAELWSFDTIEDVATALNHKYVDTTSQVMLFLKASRGARLERLMDALATPHGE
jgi:UDP-N-acetylmuramyl pentapeptide synthase